MYKIEISNNTANIKIIIIAGISNSITNNLNNIYSPNVIIIDIDVLIVLLLNLCTHAIYVANPITVVTANSHQE